MPSQFSSDHSVNDAVALAENLGIQYDIVADQGYVRLISRKTYLRYSAICLSTSQKKTYKPRVRGTLNMAISNKFGNILLNTSNKSEMAVGYGTLYGDLAGGISVIGDVYKTDVFRMAEYMNKDGVVVPVNTMTKPPSAELRPDQKDSDSLPDYAIY